MHILIETERLIIRPISLADEKGMFGMDSDSIVHKYIGNKPLQSIEQSREVIGFVTQQYEELGIGRWAVIEKVSNDFVGWTGFKLMTTAVNGHYDFGYRLARRFWGKGYATEAGKAALHYGIDTLKFKDIYGMTDIDNLASRRVLEKVGLTYIEIFKYDAEPNWREKDAPTTWYKWIEPV